MIRAKFRSPLANYFRNNLGFLLLVSLFFILGITAGALGIQFLSVDQESKLVEYLDAFFAGFSVEPVDTVLLAERSILNNLQIILVIWFLGLTVIGIPLILLVVLLRGFVLGFTVGFLVQKKAWQGIAVVCLSIVPQSLLYVPALILAGAAAVSFSLSLLGRWSPMRSARRSRSLLSYCLLMAILSLAGIVAGLIEAIVTPVFLKLLVSYL